MTESQRFAAVAYHAGCHCTIDHARSLMTGYRKHSDLLRLLSVLKHSHAIASMENYDHYLSQVYID